MTFKGGMWAIDAPTKNAGQSAVLMFLGLRSDQKGFCWWGAAKIGEQCGMHRNSVDKYINELVEAGLLVKVKRRARVDGKLGTWLFWVPCVAKPATLPKGEPWPDQREIDANLRRIKKLKIGGGDWVKPVRNPVDDEDTMHNRVCVDLAQASVQQKGKSLLEMKKGAYGSVTYIGDRERPAS